MCCSEMWKHQRRSEWNKHAQDSFLWHHMPAKTEEAKEMDRFYAEAEEDVDARLERPRPCARWTSMTWNFTRLMNSGLNLKRELK